MKDNRKLLSIGIPTYNGEKTIGNMLSILLPQITEEVEIFISDNCSTDKTPQIIQRFQSDYPMLKYIRNEVNIGPDANFLQCMRVATGRFTYLLSDDDILVEGALEKILNYLRKHSDVALVYLESVGFSMEYKGLESCHAYTEKVKPIMSDIYTSDRHEFMDYAIRMWGFLSSFLWSTDRFREIMVPEQFFGTYWLQSYIHIGCCADEKAYLGIIKGPCLAAGEYKGINNFSAAVVDGVYYKQMLLYACEIGHFDRKQLKDFWLWRICFLGRFAVIKERDCGNYRTSKMALFKLTWRYPYAWFALYPYFFVPRFMITLRHMILGTSKVDTVKREIVEDNKTV